MLFPEGTYKKISEPTAQWWLWKLGYRNTESKKGIYSDSHEWPDVLAYQKKFIDHMSMDNGYGSYVSLFISRTNSIFITSGSFPSMMEMRWSHCCLHFPIITISLGSNITIYFTLIQL